MFNASSCNKDFREWSESIMTRTQELIKKLKETQRDLQWQCDMEIHRLESKIKKQEEAVIYVERYHFVSNNWFKIIKEY